MDIATTQTSVGKAEIEQIILEWAAAAEGDGEKFRSILKAKIHDRISPAVEGPNLWNGNQPTLYLCDGHHRASAVFRILHADWNTLPTEVKTLMPKSLQQSWREQNDLKIRLGVDQKFSSKEELVNAFRRGNLGQIPFEEEQLKKAASSNPEQLLRLYRQLAPNLASLKDSPWRSAIGSAFSRMGVKGEHFENYIEFQVAELLEKKYPELKKFLNDPLNHTFQKRLERILLTDTDIFSLLQTKTKSGATGKWEADWENKRTKLPLKKSCAGRFRNFEMM